MFLGHKKCKTCWGLNKDSEGNMFSFLALTRTHIFVNHSDGYGCLSTAHVWSSTVAKNRFSNGFEVLLQFWTAEIKTFKLDY
jgi:hypothetical protein